MHISFYFRGQIKPYLQGHNALEVINQTPGFLECYLGSKRTRIRLRDFRPTVRDAAKRALDGQQTEQFARIFEQPARAKIRLAKGKVQIDLYDVCPKQEAPTLWLGVVRDGEMLPFAHANWEFFRPAGKARTGFAILSSPA